MFIAGRKHRHCRSRLILGLGLAACILCLPACASMDNFTLLGYSPRPLHDTNIRTVYVPIFKNRTFRKGMEFDLTRAVIREIESKTPYKVVSDPSCADTELCGTIINVSKNLVNINQMNEVREAETTVSVEVVWRDLRSGEILSQPTRVPGAPPGAAGMPPPYAPPDAPPPTPTPPAPVIVQSTDRFIPELGQSITTAFQGNVDKLATQIVSMMETPW